MSDVVIAPEQEEIWNECLELMDSKTLFEKEFTKRVREVYCRESDKTYWAVEYDKSHDGDYNQLRDDKVEIYSVVPKEVITIIYVRESSSAAT